MDWLKYFVLASLTIVQIQSCSKTLPQLTPIDETSKISAEELKNQNYQSNGIIAFHTPELKGKFRFKLGITKDKILLNVIGPFRRIIASGYKDNDIFILKDNYNKKYHTLIDEDLDSLLLTKISLTTIKSIIYGQHQIADDKFLVSLQNNRPYQLKTLDGESTFILDKWKQQKNIYYPHYISLQNPKNNLSLILNIDQITLPDHLAIQKPQNDFF